MKILVTGTAGFIGYHLAKKLLQRAKKQQKIVSAWMEIHHDELVANWELAVVGETPYKIDRLK